jgi:hypothetical protein
MPECSFRAATCLDARLKHAGMTSQNGQQLLALYALQGDRQERINDSRMDTDSTRKLEKIRVDLCESVSQSVSPWKPY